MVLNKEKSMISQVKKIYRYNDNISFRQCSLSNETINLTYGDCTSFYEKEENWKTYYYCSQYGIHFHCTKHPEFELIKLEKQFYTDKYILKCPKCDNEIEVTDLKDLVKDCLKLLNISKFKDAQFIRLDDWYTPEIKKKVETDTDYWVKVDVKTDRDNDTIIVLYVGNKNSKEKAQFFIKPEKMQLTSDHKDLDPSKIISKIEVTLKGKTLKQEYED